MEKPLQTINGLAAVFRARRMLSSGIIALGLLWCGATTVAQESAEPSPTTRQIDAPLLDISHARIAFDLAQDWVRQSNVDEPVPATAAGLHRVTGLLGVRLTLRWSGRTIGVGEAHRAVGDNPEASVELLPLLRMATDAALRRSDQSLQDAALRARLASPEPAEDQPALPPLQRYAHLFTLDLQLAHRGERVLLPPRARVDDLLQRFEPGLHGLRLWRDATRSAAWVWPASALAANQAPASAATSALTELGLDVMPTPDGGSPLLEPTLRADRFEVFHLAQLQPQQAPSVLTRGVPTRPVTPLPRAELEELARTLAVHLVERQRPDGSFAGTFEPSSDRWNPENAPLPEAALAALALGRFAVIMPENSRAVVNAHLRAASLLRDQLLRPGSDADASAAALLLLASSHGPLPTLTPSDRDALVAQLLKRRDDQGALPQAQLTGPTVAIILAALADQAQRTRDPQLLSSVTLAQDFLWTHTTPQRLTALLPWIAMTESALEQLDPQRPTRHLVLLRDAARELRDRQIPSGGYNLGPAQAMIPTADWRSAQVLAFQAYALRDENLSFGQDHAAWLVHCGHAARFLDYLTWRPSMGYYVRPDSPALGGLRLATWDNRVALGPTAMALWALTQLHQTLEVVRPRIFRAPIDSSTNK